MIILFINIMSEREIANGVISTLVAQGLMNYRAKVKNIAHEYATFYNSNNSKIIINRVCDIVMPEHLEFIMNNNYSKEKFITELKKTVLTLILCDEHKIIFPINLLINLSEPIYCKNKIYIKTYFNTFFGNLSFTSIQSDTIEFLLNNYDNLSCYIQKFGLVCKLTYADRPEQIMLANNDFERVFQELSYIEFNMKNIVTDNNTYKFHVDFESLSKGFFIESNCINNLSEIILTIQNDQERFFLNKFLIQTKCVKINENMIYFPFNCDKSFDDTTTDSYEGGINFSRLDSSRLILTFSKQIDYIKIYNLGSKMFERIKKKIYVHESNHFHSGERNYNNQPTRKMFTCNCLKKNNNNLHLKK